MDNGILLINLSKTYPTPTVGCETELGIRAYYQQIPKSYFIPYFTGPTWFSFGNPQILHSRKIYEHYSVIQIIHMTNLHQDDPSDLLASQSSSFGKSVVVIHK